VTPQIAAGLALAISASLALNIGFLLQHAGASEAPPVNLLKPIATVAGLLKRRIWLLGLALGTAGWAMHVAALSRAPLSLVQAFVAGGLALLAPIARRWFGQRLRRAESIAVAVMGLGLAALALGVHEPRGGGALPGATLAVFLTGCAVLAGAVAARRAAVPLAVAGGLLYGAADTAIKALTLVDAHHGLGAAVTSPWLPAAAVLTAGAFFAFQRALQLGRPVTSIALMTAATYAVSIVAGLAVLSEPLGHGTLGIVHLAAFAAVVGAACVLAPVQARVADQRAGGTYSGMRKSPSVGPGRLVRRTRGSVSAGIRRASWPARRRSRLTGRSP
jgi:drug/metabolite transporter (DMT)-like permease